MDENSQKYDYDVALSFAGEDRAYVERVANFIEENNVSVFYDKYEEVNLWGKNLYEHLSEVYFSKAKYVVLFISKHYKEKVWTNHERQNAQARAISEKREYILPARFDDTEIIGMLPTVGYISLNNRSPEDFAQLIIKKVLGVDFSKSNLNSLSSKTESYQNLVLLNLFSDGERPNFIEAEKISITEKIELTLKPSHQIQVSFLSKLSKIKGTDIRIAFKLQSFIAQISSVNQVIEHSKELWHVVLIPKEKNNSYLFEVNFEGFSVDQLAEMRARRVLLNEKINTHYNDSSLISQVRHASLENYVSGGVNVRVAVKGSPFPMFYEVLKDNPSPFLAVARLFAVDMLIQSNTVEYINQFDLEFLDSDQLSVEFEGIRGRRASNVEPKKIRVKGICNLVG